MARTSLSRYTMLVWLPGYLVVSIDLDRERRIRNWLLQQPLLISVNGLTYQHRLSLACPNPTLRLLEHVKCHFRKNRVISNRMYIRSSNISAIEPYTHTSSPVECKNRISTNFSLNWFSSITKIPSPIIVATSIVQIPFPTQKLILSKSFAVITHTHIHIHTIRSRYNILLLFTTFRQLS